MKKFVIILSGLVMILLMCAALYFTGGIYNTVSRVKVTPYFFQPNALNTQRPGITTTPEELGETAMIKMLIKKYVMEYFYVLPNTANIEARMGKHSPLADMSDPWVFQKWQTDIVPHLLQMAEHGMLRSIYVSDDMYKRPDSDYWMVMYEEKTWSVPNDMSAEPTTSRGILDIKVRYLPGVKTPEVLGMSVEKYLRQGYDPAGVFWFAVEDLEIRKSK